MVMNGYAGGAVYNHYLAKQMDNSTDDLRVTVKEWDSKSLVGRVLSAFNPLVDEELRAKAARDLIDARENPDGETARKINWKIEAYRDRKMDSVAK